VTSGILSRGTGEPDARHFSRLRWRCRRGLLELDLILGTFLEQQYPHLPADEQAAFERLLALPDETLSGYVQGQNSVAQEFEQIVRKIRQ
jgi:antitoxin CptB